MNRLLSAAVLLAVAWVGSAANPKEDAKEKDAERRVKDLESACEAYATNPANAKGKYPEKLADLITPPFSKSSYLKNGKDDLIDPWGKEFKYEVTKDKSGRVRTYIWTERTVEGKTKVYGEKPPKS
jgi:hypothetical protein